MSPADEAQARPINLLERQSMTAPVFEFATGARAPVRGEFADVVGGSLVTLESLDAPSEVAAGGCYVVDCGGHAFVTQRAEYRA